MLEPFLNQCERVLKEVEVVRYLRKEKYVSPVPAATLKRWRVPFQNQAKSNEQVRELYKHNLHNRSLRGVIYSVPR